VALWQHSDMQVLMSQSSIEGAQASTL